MELLFSNENYDNVPEDTDEKEYCDRYVHELAASLSEFDEQVKCRDTNIGHGADLPVVLVEIFENQTFLTAAGLGGMFFLGNQINKNIDGWLEIAKKLAALFRKVRPFRIDENAAMLIALDDAAQSNDKLDNIQLSVEIVIFTPDPAGKYNLDKRPDAVYLVKINTEDNFLLYGIKSNGNIDFKHEYSKSWIAF